jgi:hypothetical protein
MEEATDRRLFSQAVVRVDSRMHGHQAEEPLQLQLD